MSKVFNRDVRLTGWAWLYVNEVLVVDGDGNINAPIATTNATFTGNTTIGDSSSDTNTINATSTILAPVTVWVNDSWHDVKFFGATSWAYQLWDESADSLLLVGWAKLNAQGTVTVWVDDTGYDVQFFGATSGKSWLRDESADKMIVTGDASVSWTVTIPAWGKIVSSVSNTFYPVQLDQTQQALSWAGAVTLTQYYTAITNTGSDALTLADWTVTGQLKKVKMIVDPWTDSTLTFNTNATIVFADVGDYALLIWNWSDWIPIELGNDADWATAPVYTPAS